MSDIQVVEKQNEIIRIQSEIINELFLQLLNHITLSEADSLPVLQKINTAAKIRSELGIAPESEV